MKIMGPPSEQWDVVLRLLAGLGADPLFTAEIAPAIWAAATRGGVDPVGAIAQSAKETNWGRFTGVVPAWFRNPAGIKVHPDVQNLAPEVMGGDRLLAHERFGSWPHGADAQINHLKAYCGIPVADVTHARYWAVYGNHRITDFLELSGRWAGKGYGEGITSIASRLVEVGL